MPHDFIWRTGHLNWVTWSLVQVRHYTQCSSHLTQRTHYDSSTLKTIRKSLPKRRQPQYLWQKLGGLRIRKQFRSRKKRHFGRTVSIPADFNAYPNGVPVTSAGGWPLNESPRLQSSNIPQIPSISASNIRSLLCKIDELQAIVDVYEPDII